MADDKDKDKEEYRNRSMDHPNVYTDTDVDSVSVMSDVQSIVSDDLDQRFSRQQVTRLSRQ